MLRTADKATWGRGWPPTDLAWPDDLMSQPRGSVCACLCVSALWLARDSASWAVLPGRMPPARTVAAQARCNGQRIDPSAAGGCCSLPGAVERLVGCSYVLCVRAVLRTLCVCTYCTSHISANYNSLMTEQSSWPALTQSCLRLRAVRWAGSVAGGASGGGRGAKNPNARRASGPPPGR